MGLNELMGIFRYLKFQPEIGLISRESIPFVHAPTIVKKLQVKSVDLNDFATSLYSYDLFAQSLYSSFNISLPDDFFPSVCGILSSINTRVCPALLPTMILYEQAASRSSNGRNLNKDREIWISNRHFFNEKVAIVAVETMDLLKIYEIFDAEQHLKRNQSMRWQDGKLLVDAVQERFLKEHKSLDARLCLGIALGRRCAGNSWMEEKGFHYLDAGKKFHCNFMHKEC